MQVMGTKLAQGKKKICKLKVRDKNVRTDRVSILETVIFYQVLYTRDAHKMIQMSPD